MIGLVEMSRSIHYIFLRIEGLEQSDLLESMSDFLKSPPPLFLTLRSRCQAPAPHISLPNVGIHLLG